MARPVSFFQGLQDRIISDSDFLVNSKFGDVNRATFQANPNSKKPTYDKALKNIGSGFFVAVPMKELKA